MCSTLRLGKSTDRSPWEIDISLITCNTLKSSLDQGKQPERAFELCDAMQQQGVMPNVATHIALLQGLSATG